ncbi:MAG: hypothetical protein ABFS10_01005 [Bacteroidota bacterium]
MKVYSISKPAFWGIVLLILLLPPSRHWKLMFGGERTTGTVGEFAPMWHEAYFEGQVLEHASEVFFTAGDSICMTHGPINYPLTYGKKVIVIYKRNNPSKSCIVTFSALYHTNYSVLLIIILVVWLAFYLSYNRYRKKATPS